MFQIPKSIPDMPAGLANAIPEQSVQDVIVQYAKNISQFGILIVILFNMGSIAREKEGVTAAMVLTKPIRRREVILTVSPRLIIVTLTLSELRFEREEI